MIVCYNITKMIIVDDNATDEQINNIVDQDSGNEASCWWKEESSYIGSRNNVTFFDCDGNIMEEF